MGGKKKSRQRQRHQARLAAAAAAAAARRKAKRQRLIAAGGVVAVLAGIVVVTAGGGGGDSQNVTAGTTTSAPRGDSEARPSQCVEVSQPLPAGAPPVPVRVGPPPTALVTEDLKPGTGATVTPGATVTVNYIGVACSTGKIFDSSYSRNRPGTFNLNQVIKGWIDGIPGMKVGGLRLLGIPPDQAYGRAGKPPNIGPDETLWFVVEVVDTKAA